MVACVITGVRLLPPYHCHHYCYDTTANNYVISKNRSNARYDDHVGTQCAAMHTSCTHTQTHMRTRVCARRSAGGGAALCPCVRRRGSRKWASSPRSELFRRSPPRRASPPPDAVEESLFLPLARESLSLRPPLPTRASEELQNSNSGRTRTGVLPRALSLGNADVSVSSRLGVPTTRNAGLSTLCHHVHLCECNCGACRISRWAAVS